MGGLVPPNGEQLMTKNVSRETKVPVVFTGYRETPEGDGIVGRVIDHISTPAELQRAERAAHKQLGFDPNSNDGRCDHVTTMLYGKAS